MDKKDEWSWEDAERLGPYQLREQVPQEVHRSRGELFLAVNETSGATALVFKPAGEGGAEPLTDWRVCCVSSASPGYLALEVENSPWSVSPDEQSVETLLCSLEDVRAGVERMTQAFSDSNKPRPWRHPGLGLASVVFVCFLVLALLRMNSASQPPSDPEPLVRATPAPMSHEEPTDASMSEPFISSWLGDTAQQDESVLARSLPLQPYKGQKRPPCTRLVEVELIGACWGPHELKAPCPDELHEHQGKCYVPIFSAKPPPQSFGQ